MHTFTVKRFIDLFVITTIIATTSPTVIQAHRLTWPFNSKKHFTFWTQVLGPRKKTYSVWKTLFRDKQPKQISKKNSYKPLTQPQNKTGQKIAIIPLQDKPIKLELTGSPNKAYFCVGPQNLVADNRFCNHSIYTGSFTITNTSASEDKGSTRMFVFINRTGKNIEVKRPKQTNLAKSNDTKFTQQKITMSYEERNFDKLIFDTSLSLVKSYDQIYTGSNINHGDMYIAQISSPSMLSATKVNMLQSSMPIWIEYHLKPAKITRFNNSQDRQKPIEKATLHSYYIINPIYRDPFRRFVTPVIYNKPDIYIRVEGFSASYVR